jgi:excisionase family DNA binding protein
MNRLQQDLQRVKPQDAGSTPPDSPPEILTPKQAAALLQLGLSTLYRLTRCKKIPSFKLGRSVRYRRVQLLALERGR